MQSGSPALAQQTVNSDSDTKVIDSTGPLGTDHGAASASARLMHGAIGTSPHVSV